MTLLPLLLSAWWADFEDPHQLMDQHFGLSFLPERLLLSNIRDRFYTPLRNKAVLEFYQRSLSDFLRPGEVQSATSAIGIDKNTFEVILDVQQFKPEEISVKLVGRFVVVEAKHEEKRDQHGLISRQFVRKYLLPDQADADNLTSSISPGGILTIRAPMKQTEEKPNERTINIEVAGIPAVRVGTNVPPQTTETPSTAEKTGENREETTENPQAESPTAENQPPENPTAENQPPENPTAENQPPENPTAENPPPENPTAENPSPENPTDEKPEK